jgi:glutamate mutase epsilon subunit
MTETILISSISALIGGLISFSLQYVKFKHEVKKLNLSHKTDFMAETTAVHFLSHKSYTDRSFETLKQHLGGFNDDELRKILVRAGAIRVFRDGDESDEWWRLLSRNKEYIKKKRFHS